MSDEDLNPDVWQAAAVGDTRALAKVFEGQRERLRRTIQLRMDPRLRGRLDPSDILQEAFLDAARRLPEYVAAPTTPLTLWLRSLTLQRLVDLHRQHLGAKMRDAGREVFAVGRDVLESSSFTMANLLVDPANSPAAEIVHREQCRRVHEALESLEGLDREVLAMRHFEQMSNSDVAQVLQISVTAASNRYVRAVTRLKQVLSTFADTDT